MSYSGRDQNGVYQDQFDKPASLTAPLVRSQSNGATPNTSKRSFNMPLQRTDQNNNNYYDQQLQQLALQRQDQQQEQQQSIKKIDDDGSGMSQFQQICQKFQLKMEDIMNIMQGFQSKNGVSSVTGGSANEGEQLKTRTEVQELKRLTEEIFESQPREQEYFEDQEEQVFSEQAEMEKQNSSSNRNSKNMHFSDSRNDHRLIPPPPSQVQNENQQQKLYISTCNSNSQKLNSCDFHLDLESENVQSRRSSVLHYSNPQQPNNGNQEENEEYYQEQQQYSYPQVSLQTHKVMNQLKDVSLSEELQCQVRLFEDGFAVLSINNGIEFPQEEQNDKMIDVSEKNIHLGTESFGSQSESFSEHKKLNVSNSNKTKEHQKQPQDISASAYAFQSGLTTENSPDKSEISFTNQTFSNSVNAGNLNENVLQINKHQYNNQNGFNLTNPIDANRNSFNRLDNSHSNHIHNKINNFDSNSSTSSLSPHRCSRKDDNPHRSSKLESPVEEINRGIKHSGFGVSNNREIQKLSESEQIREMKKNAIYQDPQSVNQQYSFNNHPQQQVYPSFRGIQQQNHIDEDIQSNQNPTQGFHNVDLEYQSEVLLNNIEDNTHQLQKSLNSFGEIRQEYFSVESSDTQQQSKYFQQQQQQQNGESKQQEFREEMCDAFSLDPRNKQTAFQIASVGMMNSLGKSDFQEDQYKSKEEHRLEFKNDSAYSTPAAGTTESLFFQQGNQDNEKQQEYIHNGDGDQHKQVRSQQSHLFQPKIQDNNNNNPQKNEILLEKYSQEIKRLQQENSLQRQEISELNGKLSGIQDSKRDFELVVSSLKQNLDWVTSLLRKKEEDYLTLFEKYNGVIEKMQRIEFAKISSYSGIGNKENTQYNHNISDFNNDYTKNHTNNSNQKVCSTSKNNRSSSNNSNDSAHQISGVLTESSINNNNNFTQLRPPIVRNVKRLVNYDDQQGRNISNSSSNHVSNENINASNIIRGMPSSNVSSIRSHHSFSSQEHTDTNKKNNRVSLSPSSQQKGMYQESNVKMHSGQQSTDERISQNGPKQQIIDSARNTESTRNSSRHRDFMDSQQQQQQNSQQQSNTYTAGSVNNKITSSTGSSILPVNIASRGYTDQFKKQKIYQNTQGIDGSNNKQSLDELRSFCLRKK